MIAATTAELVEELKRRGIDRDVLEELAAAGVKGGTLGGDEHRANRIVKVWAFLLLLVAALVPWAAALRFMVRGCG